MSTTYEIERKFLVTKLPEELGATSSKHLRQGYITTGETEVRLRHNGAQATLTCKKGNGLKRQEQEIKITDEQFESLWPLTEKSRIEKTRYNIPFQDLTIELDVYHGVHEPLLVAEVEFEDEPQSQAFAPPDYFGPEVTNDFRYKNQSLATKGLPPTS
ncbi:CYTH domain-containing protein [Pelagicoccus mobilis]|uniref:CYTH domain-containing protein n=1 Tax=Pelagicoccus mobilis TaxID=415221 RepID=A0A934S1F0_9BACT|nr:CYTH domain-containing protein [Pelagicoccus mobilis]MBK1877338.1 CYTH domain-containing protein [Pelagicoccus mobilis]